jgi:hypothetical protein
LASNGTAVDSGDRTTYNWGTHTILNGLELGLSSMFWNFGRESFFRKFNKIEYWAVGDDAAIRSFDKISKHLVQQFGEPDSKREPDAIPERSWEWKLGEVDISLCLFEQHAFKTYFEVSRRKPTSLLKKIFKLFQS